MAGKLVFARKERGQKGRNEPPWYVLVVDDDAEVHSVTRLALRDLHHQDRPLEILSAYSAAEAREILCQRGDIAIVLLDVVMETDDAGLQLVRYIRDELQNRAARIILRTGQPGQAPEESVIVAYEIDDYKAKTELTAQKLFTATLTALRAYDDILSLEKHRAGLRQIIDSTDSLFRLRSLQQFAAGVLLQLGTFLGVGGHGILCMQREPVGGNGITVLAASQEYQADHQAPLDKLTVPPEVNAAIHACFQQRRHQFGEEHTVLYLGADNGLEIAAYLHCPSPADPLATDLIGVFCAKIAVGFSNLRLYEELVRSNEQLEQKVSERTRALEEANAILERLATTDPLTGIANRRHFMSLASREVLRCKRNGSPMAVISLDIDHFKQINDRYGHAAGDIALLEVVERVGQALRTLDVLGRVGGEEFAILLPDAGLEGAAMVAERLREAMAGQPMNLGGDVVTVTASLGVAALTGDETLDGLLSRADKALYAAKNNGRNRVEQAQGG